MTSISSNLVSATKGLPDAHKKGFNFYCSLSHKRSLHYLYLFCLAREHVKTLALLCLSQVSLNLRYRISASQHFVLIVRLVSRELHSMAYCLDVLNMNEYLIGFC